MLMIGDGRPDPQRFRNKKPTPSMLGNPAVTPREISVPQWLLSVQRIAWRQVRTCVLGSIQYLHPINDHNPLIRDRDDPEPVFQTAPRSRNSSMKRQGWL